MTTPTVGLTKAQPTSNTHLLHKNPIPFYFLADSYRSLGDCLRLWHGVQLNIMSLAGSFYTSTRYYISINPDIKYGLCQYCHKKDKNQNNECIYYAEGLAVDFDNNRGCKLLLTAVNPAVSLCLWFGSIFSARP
jgi:hypothetical protein